MNSVLSRVDPAKDLNIYDYSHTFKSDLDVWKQKIPSYNEIKPLICTFDIETRGLDVDADNAVVLSIEVSLNGEYYVWDIGTNVDGSYYENLWHREKAMLTGVIAWA